MCDVSFVSSFSEGEEDVVPVIPKPVTPLHHQPLYLCLRISKKHWCRHHSMGERALEHGEDLHDRDQKRREYWFAIPPSRCVFEQRGKKKGLQLNVNVHPLIS